MTGCQLTPNLRLFTSQCLDKLNVMENVRVGLLTHDYTADSLSITVCVVSVCFYWSIQSILVLLYLIPVIQG